MATYIAKIVKKYEIFKPYRVEVSLDVYCVTYKIQILQYNIYTDFGDKKKIYI